MSLHDRIASSSLILIRSEIESVSRALALGEDKGLERNAMAIAERFLQWNKVADPITVARASFYVALKQVDDSANEKVDAIIRNNGKKNRWWLYVAPMMESASSTRLPV
jgi:L-rhamnose mutarotase